MTGGKGSTGASKHVRATRSTTQSRFRDLPDPKSRGTGQRKDEPQGENTKGLSFYFMSDQIYPMW